MGVIEEATGGLLFVEEAYRLSRGGPQKNTFGQEAIEQLMSVMNEPPDKAPIMVFAGYTHNMEEFMKVNDGLYRRIPYTFNFSDYSCAALAEILEVMTKKKGFELEPCLTSKSRQLLSTIIEKETLPRSRLMMNGGICERIFDLGKQQLDMRDDKTNPSVELNESDIRAACSLIPPPPSDDGDKSSQDAKQADEELRSQFAKLQEELLKLKDENLKLKEAAQSDIKFGGTGQEGLVKHVKELTAKLEAADKHNKELKGSLAR